MVMSRLNFLAVIYFVSCTACSAFECGAPLAVCGEYVPKDAKCAKGNGWCQAGHYCASTESESDKGQLKCLPVPKDCGTAGNVCCPSNTDTPHTASTKALDRVPFCRDGSTCFYDPLASIVSYWESGVTPVYAGAPGYACVAVPKDCGSKAGALCCPNPYSLFNSGTTTAPALNQQAQCSHNMFCEFDNLGKADGPKYPGSNLLSMPIGLCVANTPDCGKLGKRCCVSQGSGSFVAYGCNPENGKKGYCVSASGKDQGLICTQCPDKVPADFKHASECSGLVYSGG